MSPEWNYSKPKRKQKLTQVYEDFKKQNENSKRIKKQKEKERE